MRQSSALMLIPRLLGILVLCLFTASAPRAAAQVTPPGSAAQFDGINDEAAVAHPSLLAFPFTATAWVRTTQNVAPPKSLVNLYLNGSGNGYSVTLRNGRIEAWYYAAINRYIYIGENGTASDLISDGNWHHVAFVVDATSGRLYLDGVLHRTRAWAGAPGPPTSPESLRIGRYDTAANGYLAAQLDEVSIWASALNEGDLHLLRFRSAVGTEPTLRALWRCDEAVGSTRLTDASFNARHAFYVNAPAIVASTAPVGKTISGYLDSAVLERNIVIKAANEDFKVNVAGRFRRFSATDPANVSAALSWQLIDITAGNVPVALQQNTLARSVTLAAVPGQDAAFTAALPIIPAVGAVIFPRHSYKIAVTLSHTDPVAGNVTDHSRETSPRNMLKLSGNLIAGSSEVRFGILTNDPIAAATSGVNDPNLVTVLAIPPYGGFLHQKAGFFFGGSTFGVLVNGPTGDAVVTSGSAPVVGTARGPLSPGKAISFNGSSGSWTFTDENIAAFNSMPLTVSAWIKTSVNDSQGRGVVSKYSDTTFNGWSVVLQNGRIYSFYAVNSSRAVFTPPLGLDGGFVADGNWHHIVVTYNTAGGRIYVDGVHKNSVPWIGTPGTSTSTNAVQVGRYHNYPVSFLGEIDEISIWSASLTDQQVFDLRDRAPMGNELGLEALWRCDETGSIRDWSGKNRTLYLSAAIVTSTAPIYRITPDIDTSAGISFERQSVTFGPSGLIAANVINRLPVGVGWSATRDNRVLETEMSIPNVALTGSLAIAAPSLTWPAPGGVAYLSEETKPLWFHIASLAWAPATGTFTASVAGAVTFVRETETQLLSVAAAPAQQPFSPDMQFKPSNDLFYRAATGRSSLTIETDGNGFAQLTTALTFGSGNFESHFPGGTSITATGGTAQINDDKFDPASGRLNVSAMSVRYAGGCSGDCAAALPAAGIQTIKVSLDSTALFWTEDGGLRGEGVTEAGESPGTAAELRLGAHFDGATVRYAHRAHAFARARWFMPGHVFMGDSPLSQELRPVDLLLSGRGRPTAENYVERVTSAEYQLGLADYAGLNFRAASNGSQRGSSRLAGQDFNNYPLPACAKYYVRGGGISGIHQATTGAVQGNFLLSGYQTQLNGLRFGFRDSEMVDSYVDGQFTFPFPSQIAVPFERIYFNCLGGLRSADLPAGLSRRTLAYWNARIQPRTLEFARPNDKKCDPKVGYAVMGVESFVSHVPQPCQGVIGINPDGTLIAASDAPNTGPNVLVDSRFALPNSIELRGPAGQKSYNVTPVTRAYYNRWPGNGGQPSAGFITFAATLTVGFFGEVPVHVITSGSDDPATTAPVYVTGGTAWNVGGATYFNNKKFDSTNRGLPAGISSVTDYAANAAYRARVKKKWVELLTFDMPVKWDPALRVFASAEDGSVSLPILEIPLASRASYLSAEIADLQFSKTFEISGLTLANSLYDAAAGATGFNDALRRALNNAPVVTQFQDGMRSLDRVLNSNPNALFAGPLNAAVQSGPLQVSLEASALLLQSQLSALTGPDYIAQAKAIIDNDTALGNALGSGLTDALLGADPDSPLALRGRLRAEISRVRSAVQSLRAFIAKSGGQRTVAANIAREVIRNQAANLLGGQLDSALAKEVEGLEPVFVQLETVLTEIDTALTTAFNTLNGGAFQTQLQEALNGSLTSVRTQVRTSLKKWIDEFNPAIANGNPFDDIDPVAFRKKIVARAVESFLGQPVGGSLQAVMRERLSDTDGALRTAAGSVFQTVNNLVRTAVAKYLVKAVDDIAGMGGNLSGAGAVGSIAGQAVIRGESLNCLRLDGKLGFKAGVEFSFQGYILVKEKVAAGPGVCGLAEGVRRVEVTMGAEAALMEWAAGAGTRVYVEVRFTFDNSKLAGFAGKFGIKGEFDLQAIKLKEADCGISAGAGELYLGARARGELSGWEMAVGIFIGRACEAKTLAFVDPSVTGADSLLGPAAAARPFTGLYGFGECWVPLNELLGIPSSCMLKLAGGLGVTTFVNLEDVLHPRFGGRMLMGVEGRVLCIATVRLTITLGGSIMVDLTRLSDPLLVAQVYFNPVAASQLIDSLRLVGTASASGKVLFVPFKFKITVWYEDGDFGYEL